MGDGIVQAHHIPVCIAAHVGKWAKQDSPARKLPCERLVLVKVGYLDALRRGFDDGVHDV